MTDTAVKTGSGLWLPLRYALRELRGGLNGFMIFIACLVLGVAVIASVGSITSAISDSLDREGRSILGGDLQIRFFQKEGPESLKDWAIEQNASLVRHSRLRTMARNTAVETSTLVELRGLEDGFPLYGDLDFESDYALAEALVLKEGPDGSSSWGALLDDIALERLRLKIGDTLKLGNITVEVRGRLIGSPDQATLGFAFGPPVMIHLDALRASGLITTGSLINHYYNLRFADGEPDYEALKDDLGTRYDTDNWRFTDRDNAAPSLRRIIDQLSSFMVIVGLASLVVGGVGVGNAVKGYMDRKTRTIATLKILGASGRTIFWTYFLQVILIGFFAIVLGMIIGAMTPSLVSDFLPDQIPVEIASAFYPEALGLAALYGVLITIAFTVWPLGRARDLPAVRLFRDIVAPDHKRPRASYIAAILIAMGAVAGLAVWLAGDRAVAAGFMAAAMGGLVFLRGLSFAIEWIASRLPRPRSVLRRLALANLHRPGAATSAVVISLGLGLTLFSSLSLIRDNLQRQLAEDVPADAPSYFAIDIQSYDMDRFRDVLGGVDGTSDLEAVPNLRGTIEKIKGRTVDEVREEVPADYRWILSGDRGMTYGNDFVRQNKIVAGDIWPDDYTGPPEISVGAEQAEALGLDIGDTITVNLLGVTIQATVRSLREVVWERGGLNYVFIFDPNTLKAAPHTYVATFRATDEARSVAFNTLTREFPTVTLINVKEFLDQLRDVISDASAAIDATAFVAIIAGILVLGGAIAAGFRQRVYESVILKVVGARRGQVLAAYSLEFLAVGLITAIIALVLGSIGGWVVVTQVFENTFSLSWGPMLVVVGVSLSVTLILGLSSSYRALSVKANSVLRHE